MQKLADEIMGANVDLAGDYYVPQPEEVDIYRRGQRRGTLIQFWLWGCSSETEQELKRIVS